MHRSDGCESQSCRRRGEPKTSAEIRRSRFIPDRATIAASLRELTRKNAIFRWEKAEQESFVELKRRLANAETLGFYDISLPIKVVGDASPVKVGAVLVQEQNFVLFHLQAVV